MNKTPPNTRKGRWIMLTKTKRELTVQETVKALLPFYEYCVKFWKREGKTNAVAVQMALKDIEGLSANPFEPNGEDWYCDEDCLMPLTEDCYIDDYIEYIISQY